MSDDQLRRIAASERHIEKLFSLSRNVAERLASQETYSIALKSEMEKSNKNLANLVGEIKSDIATRQDAQQKRLTTTLTIVFFVITAFISPLVGIAFQVFTK